MKKANRIIAIIGAGNMGASIAKSLVSITENCEIRISDVSEEKLNNLRLHFPNLVVSTSNVHIAKDAHIIVLAVKPWLVQVVSDEIVSVLDVQKQCIVSIAAGVDLYALQQYFGEKSLLFRAIPNIAVEVLQGVTAISTHETDTTYLEEVVNLFALLGSVYVVPEAQLNAYMSLSSCGIAYAFRYVRAAMQAAVEMGIPSDDAREVVIQTLLGAAATLSQTQIHPEEAIDKVTTPAGITIRGLNAMEANGFTHAVIQGLKASFLS